jgi:hypothetical protein
MTRVETAKRTIGLRISAVQMGVAGGILAVLAGTIFEVRPPEAYGVCMACHGRDLLNWTINMLAHTNLTVAPASAIFPVLTTAGVLIGAVIGASTSGEFRWYTPEGSFKSLLYGVVVMNFALLAGGCSIRLLLRTSAGELLGAIGFIGMIGGTVLGTFWLRWRATR